MIASLAGHAAIVAIVLAAAIIILRFERFCLHDLDETSEADLQYLTRTGWVVVIVVVIPLGGIAYLYCQRMH